MADLPDWTTGVDIIAQTIAELEVDIVAQAVGNIAIDIAAQTAGDITVDIAAQTVGDIDINIAAQDGDVTIDIEAQSVGINLTGDWETKAGNDKNLSGGATIAAGAGQYIIDYTVPAGKKFYACQFSCVGYDANQQRDFRASLECPAGIFVTHFGDAFGWGISYNRALEAVAAQHVKVYAYNLDAAAAAIYATLGGYEVSA